MERRRICVRSSEWLQVLHIQQQATNNHLFSVVVNLNPHNPADMDSAISGRAICRNSFRNHGEIKFFVHNVSCSIESKSLFETVLLSNSAMVFVWKTYKVLSSHLLHPLTYRSGNFVLNDRSIASAHMACAGVIVVMMFFLLGLSLPLFIRCGIVNILLLCYACWRNNEPIQFRWGVSKWINSKSLCESMLY